MNIRDLKPPEGAPDLTSAMWRYLIYGLDDVDGEWHGYQCSEHRDEAVCFAQHHTPYMQSFALDVFTGEVVWWSWGEEA